MAKTQLELSNRAYGLVIVFLIGLLSFWGFRIAQIWQDFKGDYPREITVEGQATAYVVADKAEVSIGVSSQGPTADDVVEENTEKINKIMDAIKSYDIPEENIKTTGYNLNPNYRWTEEDGQTVDGYRLNQNIQVKVDDFTIVGDLIADATAAGANLVGGIQFSLEDQDEAKEQARQEAIAKAKTKAENIAKESGLKLGKVINYYEYSNGGVYPYGRGGDLYMEAAEDAAVSSVALPAPTIEPGQEEVSLTVNLTYRIR